MSVQDFCLLNFIVFFFRVVIRLKRGCNMICCTAKNADGRWQT